MTQDDQNELHAFVRAEWQQDLPPEALVAAKAIADKFGECVCGVLFYGSCLRTGEVEDQILDFYVIVESYSAAYQKTWLALANKILPPNVFYHEMSVGGVTIRSKYAVLSMKDLAFRVSSRCLNVSVWARFCQPCVLLHPKNDTVFSTVVEHVVTASVTMLANLIQLRPDALSARLAWVGAFNETYSAELRSERAGKGLELYLLDQGRYEQLAPLVFKRLGFDVSDNQIMDDRITKKVWPKLKRVLRRWNGKLVSFLRLVKATMTFDGGIDYLAWKIRRHSGIEIEVAEWMRNYQLIAGLMLFLKLRKTGAFK